MVFSKLVIQMHFIFHFVLCSRIQFGRQPFSKCISTLLSSPYILTLGSVTSWFPHLQPPISTQSILQATARVIFLKDNMTLFLKDLQTQEINIKM